MKTKKILSFAAGLLLACNVNLGYAQSADVTTLSGEAKQDVEAFYSVIKGGDAKAVEKQRKELLKKYKKDDQSLIAMGYYFLNEKKYDEAVKFAQIVYERDSKSQEAIFLEGETYFQQKKYGEASSKFEEAIINNRTDKRAYFKMVKVYKYINPEQALMYMMTIKQIDENDPTIDRETASIYYHINDTTKAKEDYQKYFSKVKLEDDPEGAEEYAIVLYINKDYEGSYKVVNTILPKNPNAISLNRMKFYDLVELKKYQDAEGVSKTFFKNYADTLYNYKDYETEGKLQTELKNIANATVAYKKAAEMAPEEKQADIYKGLSKAYQKTGKYDEAVEAYQKYIELTNPESIVEKLNKGRIYYMALGDTTLTDEQKNKYTELGSKLFDEVTEKDQNKSFLGPYWCAKINSRLDPNTPNDKAKERYEEALKRMEGKDDPAMADRRVECLRYISFYYLKKDQDDLSLEYADKVLAIDPEDPLAKQIHDVLIQIKESKK